MKKLSESPNKISFPRGMQFYDSVWSGDKFEYIRSLQELCIATMKIDMGRIVDENSWGPLGFEIFQ